MEQKLDLSLQISPTRLFLPPTQFLKINIERRMLRKKKLYNQARKIKMPLENQL